MGLKDFMKKMAEKQAEANKKIAENNAKYEAEKQERAEKMNATLDALHPFSGSKKRVEKQYQKERLQQLKKDHVPYCPKCHSTNLTYVAKRKRLSLGRTIVGGAVGSLAGPLGTATGAAMGGLSSNKMKKGKVKCLNCGYEWKL